MVQHQRQCRRTPNTDDVANTLDDISITMANNATRNRKKLFYNTSFWGDNFFTADTSAVGLYTTRSALSIRKLLRKPPLIQMIFPSTTSLMYTSIKASICIIYLNGLITRYYKFRGHHDIITPSTISSTTKVANITITHELQLNETTSSRIASNKKKESSQRDQHYYFWGNYYNQINTRAKLYTDTTTRVHNPTSNIALHFNEQLTRAHHQRSLRLKQIL